eukprot:scaffold148_cov341-Pavlova_lutheri.AAC.50
MVYLPKTMSSKGSVTRIGYPSIEILVARGNVQRPRRTRLRVLPERLSLVLLRPENSIGELLQVDYSCNLRVGEVGRIIGFARDAETYFSFVVGMGSSNMW